MRYCCALFGHRDASSEILPRLEAAMERLILEKGVRTFWVGGYGRFDQMAAQTARDLKKKYPDITLFLVLAYLPAPRTQHLYEGYDGTLYPEGLEQVPQKFAIVHRNRYMVKAADYCIFYVNYSWGGAAKALAYAKGHKDSDRILCI